MTARRSPTLLAPLLALAVFCATALPASATPTGQPSKSKSVAAARGRIFKPIPYRPFHPFPIPVPVPVPKLPHRTPAQPIQPTQPLADRVTDVPSDGHLCHLTVFVDYAMTPREQALVSWLTNDPELSRIAAQCHVQYIVKGDPKDPTFEAIYAGTIGSQMPVVLLSTAAGKRISKLTGKNVPGNAHDLTLKLSADIRKERAAQKRPAPRPSPQPKYAEVIDVRSSEMVDGPHIKTAAAVASSNTNRPNIVQASYSVPAAKPKPLANYVRPCPVCPQPQPNPGPYSPPNIINPMLPDTVDIDVVDETQPPQSDYSLVIMSVFLGITFFIFPAVVVAGLIVHFRNDVMAGV